jgi:predicted Zn-ribbon and HTH transcriptional regulator
MPGWDGYPDDPEEDLDRHVDGYECEKCGYTPTQRELNLGSCPRCKPIQKKDEKEP